MAPFDRRGAEFHVGMKVINGPLAISAKGVFMTHLYGPAVCCKPDVSDGGDWSCASVSGP